MEAYNHARSLIHPLPFNAGLARKDGRERRHTQEPTRQGSQSIHFAHAQRGVVNERVTGARSLSERRQYVEAQFEEKELAVVWIRQKPALKFPLFMSSHGAQPGHAGCLR